MCKKGSLIVLSGPSGVGKGTVLRELLKIDPKIKISISATTRKKREGEIDGVHYHFFDKKQFLQLASNNGMFEYAKYCENFYGTPKEPVLDFLNQGYDVILEIEVQGAKQILSSQKDVLSIFIMPPSVDELKRRLRGRGTESKEVLDIRIKRAESEIKEAENYKYVVLNDSIEKCLQEVHNIIKKQRANKKI